MFRILAVVCTYILMCASASAQSYPEPISTSVNDFADLLPPEQESELRADLEALNSDTGIEMTVITLERQSDFAPTLSFEGFATGLFNHWGIGSSERNDGIMVLIMHQDRQMRVELGRGFGSDWDAAAARSIDYVFIPAFRESGYAHGIVHGSANVITTIARPFAADQPPPEPEGNNTGIAFAIFMIAAISIPLLWRKLRQKFQRCPNCNVRFSLSTNRRVVTPATRKMPGHAQDDIQCRGCGHRDSLYRTLPVMTGVSGVSGGFGGGSSSGGGASGSW